MPARTARALNVRQYGDGPDVLVLAHGFGWNQSVWDRYVDMLAQRYRVITYDLACAYSADPSFFDMSRHREIGGYIEDLMQILDHQAVKSCRFIGHSVSGMIGLLASIRHHARFDQVITIAASPCYLNREGYHGGFSDDDLRNLLIAVDMDYRSWAEGYAPYAVDRPMGDDATSSFLDCLLAMRKDVTLATAQMILYCDYRDAMASVSVPTVILQTQIDPAVPLPVAMFLRDHIRGSRLEIIEATGHMPHLTSYEMVREALCRHLDMAPVP
ncbi:alpha/beta fold hydrolase [Dongia sp.]|uniref:alpha/beta fold hydrolase n=1 Tax=Dongia sp. TaxID=1977262 RepID=UPI0035B078A8